MLGTLLSAYLKWVSKNLHTRDFKDWAKLADQVLKDANVLNENRRKTNLASDVVSSTKLWWLQTHQEP
ncbi:hypothetical protein D8674_031415 [Pyrus ussuriensis x Pyrus communis]|uniref:Uncharacterized protein n=1 Tax=Pyrus ussuriensis x Pyrus communis TaxID=2448454 RepID=A0A5N5EZ09_9ROSA|nr:hypothetical protein D8674_031415 [Pyrus ussuriensis x Pyrus communis]